MIAFDKNSLRKLVEIFKSEWPHGLRDSTDAFVPQAAHSSIWEFIYNSIQECTIAKDLNAARHLHSLIIFHGLDSPTFISDHLIRLYTSCDCLNEANAVFCRVSVPTCYTWTAIITAHVNLEGYCIALRLFEKMQNDGVTPNKCSLLCIMKICSHESYSDLGVFVHDLLLQFTLESDVALGSLMVQAYARQGFLDEACWVFNHIAGRDIILWSAMVTAYCENGSYNEAFDLLDQMLRQGSNPDNTLFICMLKITSNMRTLEKGRLIHDLVIKYGIESDVTVGSVVIDMYAKCESLIEAKTVFAALDHKNTVSWNSLVAGHAQLGVSAFELLNQMQEQKFVPDKVTFLSVLKSCKGSGVVDHGARIHEQIVLQGLDYDCHITSALVGTYANCGNLREAHCLFEQMLWKDAIAWSELISGYTKNGDCSMAVNLFKAMQESGISPIKPTCSHMLGACSSARTIDVGMLIHHYIVLCGFDFDDSIGSLLVDLYGKCMKLEDAQNIFDSLSCKDVVAWGTLIGAYSVHDNQTAFEAFQKMQQHGIKPDKLVYLFVIKGCGTDRVIEHGWLVHNLFIDSNCKADIDVVNALVHMYADCGFFDDACKTFENAPSQDALSWGVMIAVCVEGGLFKLAFQLYARLQELGLMPDSETISCLLKASCNLEDKTCGRLLHCCLMFHSRQLDLVVGNSLVCMYFKCGLLREATHVFKNLKNPNSFSWESMITGFSQNGHGLLALEYFKNMQEKGATATPSTFASALKSCGFEGLASQGRLLHDWILRNGVDEDSVVGNSLVDMYSKCGRPQDAQKVFASILFKDEISWGALLYCNLLNGDPSNVLQLYLMMVSDGLKPDKVTASCAIKACSTMGVFKLGWWMHDQIIRSGIETDVVVGTSLVDMYAKSSCLKEALEAFNRIDTVNEASWTALLSASFQDGQMGHVEGFVNELKTHGFTPDNQTHSSVLSTWSRMGQTEKTSQYIEKLTETNTITPVNDLYNCFIDSLSRVGRLHEAEEVLFTMPMKPDIIGWVSLLTSCQTYCGIEIGSDCLDHVAKLDLNRTGSYVMMANMYTDSQKQCKASSILDIRKSVGAWKLPGKAWLELAEGLHVFNVGEELSSEAEVWNFKTVRKKLIEQGFVPQLDLVLEDRCNYRQTRDELPLVVSALSHFSS